MPLLFATPLDELGRGIPAIEKDIDLVAFGQEWSNRSEHFFSNDHFATKAQFLAAFAIEFADSSTPQVELNINREADVTNAQAHQDIDYAFAVDRLFGTRALSIIEPIHCFQAFGMSVFLCETVINTQEDLLSCTLCFCQFNCFFNLMFPQWVANIIASPRCFTEGVSC